MKTDGINPVLATRIYLYPNIAAREVMSTTSPENRVFSGNLNGLQPIEAPKNMIEHELAAIHAYYKVMLTLNYREQLCHDLYDRQIEVYKGFVPQAVFDASIAYGDKVAKIILAWAAADGYRETKARPYHHSTGRPGTWIPTPPEYRPALEPYWGALRPVTIDNLERFSQPPNVAYSADEKSPFYALARAVYDVSLDLSEEQRRIAEFWDDNPDLNNFQGHIPTPRRHINPTAHWMSIVGQVLKREKRDFVQCSQIYAAVAVAFFDANLVCWYDKFNYDLVRPVTFIQDNIDFDWLPLLVTPPFPEHTSGHSACSASCATVLTHFFGNDYAFTDSTHVASGLGVRTFSSFNAAAAEAGISRFYGGIHYMTAVQQGAIQGNTVGMHILNHLKP